MAFSIAYSANSCFQSSSGLSTGCDRSACGCSSSFRCFNPHPAFRPDATLSGCASLLPPGVSILIRPFDRMRPIVPLLSFELPGGFNPHPAFRPDATPDFRAAVDEAQFQSSSGLSTGCDSQPSSLAFRGNAVSILIRPFDRMRPHPWYAWDRPGDVSILIRPFDRMRPGKGPKRRKGKAFQSSSGLSTGCDSPPPRWQRCRRCFNPHPAFRPDATRCWPWPLARDPPGFNPHPAFRPDATPQAGG